jgi:hypothetical protein
MNLQKKNKKRKIGIKLGKGNNDEDIFEQYEYQDDDENNISKKKSKRKSKEYISNILLFNKRPRNSINYNLNYYNKVLKKGKHDFKVRKEVMDIINGNSSHNNSNNENNKEKGNISIDEEEKKFNKRFHPNILEGIMKLKKKKFKKKKKKEKGKNIHDLKKIVIENNKKKINDTKEDKVKINSEIREEKFDKRLQKFFERIHNLKNFKVKNYEEELNILIREHFYNYDDHEAKDRENRIYSFYQKFELSRKQAQSFQKYKKRDIRFISPIIFKDGTNSKDKNYNKKSID